MKKLAILGASGHGIVVAEIALDCGWSDVAFFDDAWPTLSRNGPFEVVGDTAALVEQIREFDGIHVAIGNNRVRLEKFEFFRSHGATLPSLVHPKSVISQFSSLGDGTVVMAGSVVNADTTISSACILNTGSTIDHDCTLAEGVHVSPGANVAGGVSIGRLSWIGIGATIIQCISIGSDVLVGAGSVVLSNLPDGIRVAGVPAKSIS
ncbi:putative acetyltransferase EpsM [Marinobacterium sp. xm-g-59]|uniref:acetyltransferase n=1 Tax=Marinobacterium sp. xm-g-59 TaxID=2497748 RepID=UPI0015687D7E|nr:acetyltransferase [Marinobacterium sp. xm-g-59]NRP95493.1 putative acetyltransferase EpsM [Marinobacterium sp. xm-g-59]